MITQRTISKELEEALRNLAGRKCWRFSAGPSTGSVINLDIGSKVLRRAASRNSKLAPNQQGFDSEFALFIQCSWRIDSKSRVVCGAWDDNRKDGPMIRGLRRLVGKSIESVKWSAPAFDLELRFSNELVLRVFCDSVNTSDLDDNYSLFVPRLVYVVGTKSRLAREPRAADEK